MTEESRYDVFLFYYSADQEAVQTIGRRLRGEAGLAPWLEACDFIAGTSTQEIVETAIAE